VGNCCSNYCQLVFGDSSSNSSGNVGPFVESR